MSFDEVLRRCLDRSTEARRNLFDENFSQEFMTVTELYLAFRLADLTAQHHAAMCCLFNDRALHGSARALTRPCVEAAYRSVWVSHLADADEVEAAYANHKTPWPKLEGLFGIVNSRLKVDKKIRRMLPSTGVLNDLTHGGILSLLDSLKEEEYRNGVTEMRNGLSLLCLNTADQALALSRTKLYEKGGFEDSAGKTKQIFERLLQENAADAKEHVSRAVEALRAVSSSTTNH